MRRTEIAIDPSGYPEVLKPFFAGARIYDSSCSKEARVIYLEKDEGYYLKTAPKGTLRREAEMTGYFYGKGLAPEVLFYAEEETRDVLLTARAAGEDCTDRRYLDDPKRLSALLGERLRMLHELPHGDCPVQDRMTAYLATAERNYRAGAYDLSYRMPSCCGLSAQESFRYLTEHAALLKNEVLLHGDYCLPNILLSDWHFSTFIDLGAGGVGDRHVDLYWGAWTLSFNLGTDRYRDRFYDAYGRDRIDEQMIALVSVAEAFG
jgi:kanamycin kinase